MPVDQSAAQSAQSLLNGIDYSALIGGPLEAAIKAQAMAARSTWEFINEVGLQKDADGNKSAVNVDFLYQKDGQMVRLIVPILTIVPMPLIIIDEVNIEFKANISASASSTTEQSESSALAGELEASGQVGWGPFSLAAKMKASYSSKKDSKATQDSRYSVEYTQDVRVHASQAGVPAGLATVLNILSSAATGGSIDGDLDVSPPLLLANALDPNQQQSVLVSVTNSRGLALKRTNVTLKVKADPAGKKSWETLIVGVAPVGKPQAWKPATDDKSASITVKTGDDGTVGLLVWLDPAHLGQVPPDNIVEIDISANVDGMVKEVPLPAKVMGLLALLPTLTPSKPTLDIAKGGSEKDKLEALLGDGSTPDPAPAIKVSWQPASGLVIEHKGQAVQNGGTVDTDPQTAEVELDFKVDAQASGSFDVKFTAQIDEQDAETHVKVNVK